MSWFGVELPGTFTEFGRQHHPGPTNGISSGFSFPKDKIKQLGAMVGITFAKEQEIHSPSRVFSRFGGFITEGLALGIENGQDAPINQVSGLAKRLDPARRRYRHRCDSHAGAVLRYAVTDCAACCWRQHRGPEDTVQIIVQTQAGMDEQAIARAVMLAMEERER